jgi:hypothetical protein
VAQIGSQLKGGFHEYRYRLIDRISINPHRYRRYGEAPYLVGAGEPYRALQCMSPALGVGQTDPTSAFRGEKLIARFNPHAAFSFNSDAVKGRGRRLAVSSMRKEHTERSRSTKCLGIMHDEQRNSPVKKAKKAGHAITVSASAKRPVKPKARTKTRTVESKTDTKAKRPTKKAASKFAVMYGNMEWFDVAEQPPTFEELPKQFKLAYDLWEKDKENNTGEIIKLLKSFVSMHFVPTNVGGWEELFVNAGDGGSPPSEAICYEAIWLNVVGIDFSVSPIPRCRAEAVFRVPVTENYFKIKDLDEWQENHDFFHGGVIFGWKIPRTRATESLDFTFANHSGCECFVKYTE